MKKLLITMLTALVSQSALYALPVGNLGESGHSSEGLIWDSVSTIDKYDDTASFWGMFSARLGFYGDFVFDRNMKTGLAKDSKTSILFDKVGVNTKAAMLDLNIGNTVELFGTVGLSKLEITGNRKILVYKKYDGTVMESYDKVDGLHNNSLVEYRSKEGLSWSAGFKAVLGEINGVSFGLEAQYFTFSPQTDVFVIGPSNATYKTGDKTRPKSAIAWYPIVSEGLNYQDMQVSLGLSYRINMLAPYAAVKWSSAKLTNTNFFVFTNVETNTPSVDLNFKYGNIAVSFRDQSVSNQSFSYVAGVTICATEKANLSVEGRFGGEKALSVIGQVRF